MSNDYWDPRGYSVDSAIRDIAYGTLEGVTFTENGVIKDYGDRVTQYDAYDNEKGHLSTDYRYDENGHISSIEPHSNN